MKRFAVLCALAGLFMPLVGCNKKAETKTETTVTSPEGTTTTTDTHKVETDKK